MKKYIISLITVISVLLTIPIATVSANANINIGDYLQMGTYYGEPILWRCVDIDENGPLILSDKIICIKPFDAAGDTNTTKGSHSRESNSTMWGSTYWADSNIRSWLNSAASAGNVNWLCGNPPNSKNLYYNSYDQEAGFLTNFSAEELNTVKEVRQKTIIKGEASMAEVGSEVLIYDYDIDEVAENYDKAYAEYVTDKMFLLDEKQISMVYNNRDILGEEYYIGKLTAQSVANSSYKTNILEAGSKCNSWLRSPTSDGYVRDVDRDGHIRKQYALFYNIGVRPAFYLNTAYANIVSGIGDEDNPYVVTGTQQSNTTVTSYDSEVSLWSSPEMEEAYNKGLIPENLVGENLTEPVSRAEFAAISVRLYESLAGASASGGKTPFTDIASSANKSDIEKAYKLNIAVGVSDTEFAPDMGLTREQLATMLCRTIKKYKFEGWTYDTDSEYYLDSEGVKKFADDALISDYAKSSVYYMVKMGIINGVDDTHFAPKNTTAEEEANGYASATREQAIALSLRTYKLSDLWK